MSQSCARLIFFFSHCQSEVVTRDQECSYRDQEGSYHDQEGSWTGNMAGFNIEILTDLVGVEIIFV